MGKKTKDMTSGPVKPAVNKVPPEILGRLWVVSNKLQGLGILVSNFNQDAILNQDSAAHGIGQIILETADELRELQSSIDSYQDV